MRVRSRRKLRRRLAGYWKMEAANIVLVPGLAFWLAKPRDPLDVALMVFVYGGVALLLLVGTAYWRGLLLRKLGNPAPLERALRFADRAQRPSLVWLWLAAAAALTASTLRGFSGPVIAAWAGVLLIGLEYVNYYKVQLQHFDNLADLKRLLGGRGFRRAHLARDLAVHRQRSR